MKCLSEEELIKKYPNVERSTILKMFDTLQGVDKEYGADIEALQDALLSAVDEQRSGLVVRLKAAVKSKERYVKNIEHIHQKGFESPLDGALSLYENTNRNVKDKQFNIENIYKPQKVDMQHMFNTELKNEGILDLVMSGKLDEDIARYYDNLKFPSDNYVASSVVEAAAKIIGKVNHVAVSRMQISGSSISAYENYLMAYTLDPANIVGHKEAWIAHAYKAYDWEEILKTQGHSLAKIRVILEKKYRSLESAHGAGTAYMGGARSWTFKKGEFYAYNKAWGQNNSIYGGVMASLNSAAKKIAVTKIFGDNYLVGHSRLKDYLKGLGHSNVSVLDDALDVFVGVGNVPKGGVGQKTYNALQVAKSYEASRLLNLTGITALNDLVSIFMNAQTDAGFRFSNFFNPIRDFVASVVPHDRAAVASMIHIELDEGVKELTEGLTPNKVGLIAKGLNIQMILNLSRFVTKVMKETSARGSMRILRQLVEENHTTPWSKQTLGAIGITKDMAEKLKAARLAAGEEFYVSDIVKYLDAPIEIKQDMKLRLDAYYNNRVYSGSPHAGNKERRWMKMNLPQNNYQRQIYEVISQFKAPLLRSGNTFNEMMRASNPSGNFIPTKSEMMNPIATLSSFLLFASAVGYSTVRIKRELKEVLGMKVPEEEEDNVKNIARYVMESGGLGVMGDILLTTVVGEGRYNVKMSPILDHVNAIYSAAVSGDKDAAEWSWDMASLLMPSRNLWPVKVLENTLIKDYHNSASAAGGL